MAKSSDEEESPLPQPGRIWTVEEANARIGDLSELLPQIRAWVVRLRKVHDELQRLSTFWGKELESGDNPDRELKGRLDDEWHGLTKKLEDAISSLQEEGIEVKDLETGLVDFYGLENGEIVFLCWKRGEDEVGFYHALNGGYQNRRPIRDRSHRAAASAGKSA